MSRIIAEETYKAEQTDTKLRVNFIKASSASDEDEVEKSTIRCYKCGKEGHIARVCNSDIRCNYCNKQGHIKRDCRKLKKDESDDDSDNDYVPRHDNVVNLCITGENSISELLTIDGSIDEKLTNFILDIGTARSIISLRAAKERKIKVHYLNDRIRVATQNTAEVDETEEVEVDIRGHKCKLSFLVLESLEYDALLGMDYCEKIGIVINPREREIKLRDDTIYLPRIDRYVNDYDDSYEKLLMVKDIPENEKGIWYRTYSEENEYTYASKLFRNSNGLEINDCVGSTKRIVKERMENIDFNIFTIMLHVLRFIIICMILGIFNFRRDNTKIEYKKNGVHLKSMNIAIGDDGKSERAMSELHNFHYDLRESREILQN